MAPIASYTVCKVFTETERRFLSDIGEDITEWLAANPQFEVVGRAVVQSSDRGRHCISICVFVRERRQSFFAHAASDGYIHGWASMTAPRPLCGQDVDPARPDESKGYCPACMPKMMERAGQTEEQVRAALEFNRDARSFS